MSPTSLLPESLRSTRVRRQQHRGRLIGGLAALALTAAMVPVAGRAAGCATKRGPVGPAFVDCAGTRLNIVPPGQNGLVNTIDFALGEAGTLVPQLAGMGIPAHQRDQRLMYADLIRVAPHLTDAQLLRYYKDASFDTDVAAAERIERPRAGVVIIRDKGFGVPHIFGATRADVEFGSGFASAEDRLFMMDVLRHYGRAKLSAFLGPSPSDLAIDCGIAQVAGYSESELQAQFDNLSKLYTAPFHVPTSPATTEGQQIQYDGRAYVAGVNAYILAALKDPRLLPAEYPALQEIPAPWSVTDVVATATLVQAIFATGGGNELASAQFYQSLVGRYGAAEGSKIWHDFRSQNDPEAQTSIPASFPYEQVPASVDPHSLAMPLGHPTSKSCNGGPLPAANTGLGEISVGPFTIDLTGMLPPQFGHPRHASNELMVTGAKTASGHPIAVFGPQTGYFAPEILHEIDLHGPGIDARGVSFPGTEVFVELGRGVDYAWSATSAGADIVDLVLERLCNPSGGAPSPSATTYLYKGKCIPMYERTDRQIAKPSAAAPNPPAVVTIQIERTVHGPVVGRTTARDPVTGLAVPVAVSYQRSTFGDELGSAPAFLRWNDPDVIHGPEDFQRGAGEETGTFNWTYIDANHIAYYMSGKLPVRAPDVDPNFPTWGTGQWDWRGFVPADLSAGDVHPRAIDPASGFFTNWNNKPSPDFSASDSQFAYGPVYRVQSLADRVRAVIDHRPATPADIVNAMEDGGSVDLDGSQLVPAIADVLNGAPLSAAQQNVLSVLTGWAADPFWPGGIPGAHRRDADGNGSYDQGPAVAIMDNLYPKLTHAVFDPWLNTQQYGQLTGLIGIVNAPGPIGSAYDGGWEGYLQRSFRQSLGQAAHPYSQAYCGSLSACRGALIGALQKTIDELTAAYGSADPAAWTCARSNAAGRCNPARDDIQFSAVGVGSVPGIPWINRPTFQQVIQYSEHR